MSAYIVEAETIQTIAAAAYANQAAGEPLTEERYAVLVSQLCAANLAAVGHRYPHLAGREVEDAHGMHPRIWQARAARRLPELPAAAAVADACRRYGYQCSAGPHWDGSPLALLVELLRTAAEHEAAEQAQEAARQASKAERATRASNEERGRAWIDAHRPPWAVAAIVAELHHDESDIQTDYFASRTSRTVIIGWSEYTRDLFAEMRKAAATFEPTRHLGPGCGRFKPFVAFAEDARGNGCCYYQGQPSPYHHELEPSNWFTTKAEADAWMRTQGAPEPITIGQADKPTAFVWRVQEQDIEHREKYSMGSGYFLAADRYHGWQVRKVPAEILPMDAARICAGL